MLTERKKAVAIKYGEEVSIPRVVAVGHGFIAEKIIEAAEDNGVPVVEDKTLVTKLVQLPIGGDIPPEMYDAVAKILAFLYRIDTERGALYKK